MRRVNRKNYYCSFLAWLVHYEKPRLLFPFPPFASSYERGITMWSFVHHQTRIWTIAITEYVPMARGMFTMNAQNRSSGSYCIGSLSFDNVSGSRRFFLSYKILDALKFFGLYKFSLGVNNDLMLTALAIKRCSEVDWKKIATNDVLFR